MKQMNRRGERRRSEHDILMTVMVKDSILGAQDGSV